MSAVRNRSKWLLRNRTSLDGDTTAQTAQNQMLLIMQEKVCTIGEVYFNQTTYVQIKELMCKKGVNRVCGKTEPDHDHTQRIRSHHPTFIFPCQRGYEVHASCFK